MKRTYFVVFLSAFAGGLFSLGIFGLINKTNNKLVYNQQSIPIIKTGGYSAIGAPIDFTSSAEMSVHAVVHIKTEYNNSKSYADNIYDFFGFGAPNSHSQAVMTSGSGVIISNDGYIVTNNHVVENADNVEVTLNDKRTFIAKVIGTDPSTDLALLKVEAVDLPFLTYGNSDELKIGEWVLAVGNPFNLTSTVTAGIVSAKARNINIFGDNSSIESFIQTDAAVNSGNSGGALVNTKGELVGINAAIASNTGSYSGYSFAIPVNIVSKVIDDLSKYGMVQRAYLGVSLKELDSQLADEKNIKEIKGVYVEQIIENGAADVAGVKEGDVILKINTKEVNTTSELLGVLGQFRPGDIVSLLINRNGNAMQLSNIVLKNSEGNTNIVKSDESNVVNILGATFVQVTESEKLRLRIADGVKVTQLQNGKLKNSGIKEGFIITSINSYSVKTPSDINKAIKGKKGGILLEGVYPNGMRAYYGFGL